MNTAYPEFFDFAYVPALHFDSTIKYLAQIAESEEWSFDKVNVDYKILKNYIFHTYKRLNYEGKIGLSSDLSYACINTGLYSNSSNELYLFFEKNIIPGKQPWFLKGVKEKSDRDLSKFSTLPDRASYFTNEDEKIYNVDKELRINISHILDNPDNLNRIPESIRDKPYLNNIFRGSIENTKIRIKQNYNIAVFQYYEDKLQYLLPLWLTGLDKPDIALAVSINPDFYVGHTCLTLPMAYNNARLIKKPMENWILS